ncbi:MAG: ATP synthase F1 subunit delta [Planctomycetes bacterium]|nr:ATP synthase F1 subunit delta [Planctomycetota bacterium]
MPKVEEGAVAIADVYAQSLYALADERGQADAIFEEFGDLIRYLDDDAVFASYLADARVDSDRRKAMLEKVFRGRMSDLLLDALQVLNDKDRLGILAVVYDRFRVAHEEKRGEVEVHVTTALPLTDELRAKVSAAVRQRISKTARLNETTDPDILGGLIVRIGDTKIDTSIANHLRRVRDALKARASLEIHGGRSYFEGA